MEDDVKYSHRLFYITSGLLLILLAAICALNMGYIARTFAFPLLYLFGFGSYFLYAVMIVEGVSLIIKSSLFAPKSFLFNLGLALAIIGGLFIYSVTINYDNPSNLIVDNYHQSFFGVEPSYYETGFINIFENQLGFGILGTIYCFLFAKWVNMSLALTVAIIIASIGFVLLMIKPTMKLFSYLHVKKRNRQPKPKRVKKEKVKEEDPFAEFNSFGGTNIFEQAKIVGSDEINPVRVTPEIKPVSFDEDQLDDTPSLQFRKNIHKTGMIYKPRFDLFDDDEQEETLENSFEKPVPQKASEPAFIENNIDVKPAAEQPVPTPATTPTRTFNQELLFKQPEMAQTIEIDNAPLVQPTVSKPVEQPVKKKPIKWVPPSTDLLMSYATQEALATNTAVAEERKGLINSVFRDFNIAASCSGYTIGPSITRFHINYESTGLVKSVAGIIQDISRRLSGVPVRFEATVPGFDYSGLEVPNGVVTIVSFKEVFEDLDDVKKHPFNVPFGKDITGKVIKADFNDFPHMLVSGTTGSGKSVFVNSIITTLIMRMSPEELRIVLVDPKRVEMNKYKDIPHLLCPVVNEPKDAKNVMSKLVEEMEDRYRRFEIADCSTNVKEYNEYAEEHGLQKMYYILAVLDEYADLADNCKELAAPVTSLSQKARAAGIHLLIATQRPTVNIITGTIKSNIATRVALSAASMQDSLVVLDQAGAEALMGNGDMLVKSPLVSRTGPLRLQGCYIKGKEIAHVVSYLKENYPLEYEPKFLDLEEKATEAANELINSAEFKKEGANSEEDKYLAIKEWAMCLDFVSMSKIQREWSVGFNRAGRIIKRLQDEGIVSSTPEAAAKGYKVLVNDKFYEAPEGVNSSEQEIK